MKTESRQIIPRLLSELVPPFRVVFQVCGHYSKLECLIVESHIRLTVREYSPGGDGFRFNSNNLLHDAYGVLNFPVHIRLIPFSDHAFYLLGEHRSSISFSLGMMVNYPCHYDEVRMRCVPVSSSFDQLLMPLSVRLSNRLHRPRSSPKLDLAPQLPADHQFS